jgi:hypothetical protein
MNYVYVAAMITLVAISAPGASQERGAVIERMPLYYVDPWVGTWNLDVGKSKFPPGPPLKGGKAVIGPYGHGIKCLVHTVSANGEARHWEWIAQYSGKDSPADAGLFADTVALKKTGRNTLEVVYKREGTAILSEQWVVSEGKELRITRKGMKPSGEGFSGILVYEKE